MTTATDIDWTVLDDKRVVDSAHYAARSAARGAQDKQTLLDFDDLVQEAVILCASNAEKVRGWLDEDRGLLTQWIYHRLLNKLETEKIRASKADSNEVRIERLLAAE